MTWIPKYYKISSAPDQVGPVQGTLLSFGHFRTQSIYTNLSKDDQMIISRMSFPELFFYIKNFWNFYKTLLQKLPFPKKYSEFFRRFEVYTSDLV